MVGEKNMIYCTLTQRFCDDMELNPKCLLEREVLCFETAEENDVDVY
jgi:hypothetical protein